MLSKNLPNIQISDRESKLIILSADKIRMQHRQFKAVVGGTAGPAMAGPLFWPKMVLATPFSADFIFLNFCRVTFRLIKS